jgi:hypothetical protein
MFDTFPILEKRLILEALIAGVIWAVAFIYIRKGLNARNFNVDDPNKKRLDFFYDGIYGGIAAFIAVIAKKYIKDYLIL